MRIKPLSIAITASLFILTGCGYSNENTTSNEAAQPNADLHYQQSSRLSFEQFELSNGLEVIFHVDKSDPVVAVTLAAHVGSAREKLGRTGFAHLFEHLLFLESENLGKGGLDKMSARIGGSGANGSTSRDITNYMQTVPSDALEKMIWAEADKLGFFINTVTDPVLAKEKEVVKNEKRQRVDNQPYGHVFDVISSNLYPKGHPYSWSPIGSLEDLQASTLDDVKEFFKRWYVPNNVTLVISGDFDKAQAKAWVEKYFNEIPRGLEVKPMAAQPTHLSATKQFYYEDNFAQVPQLTQVWPTVEKFHPDSYAIDVLIKLLVDGKDTPLTHELVEKRKLTSNVTLFDYRSELAGELFMMVRAFDKVDLDSVQQGIKKAFKRFETEKFSNEDLNRIKAGLETQFYRSLSSVVGKGTQLADYNLMANDPDLINKEIDLMRNVSTDDVWRVYNQYVKDKHFVSTSFVPKGQQALAVETAVLVKIKEEKVELGSEADFDASTQAEYKKTPSSFDRSIEPAYGKALVISVPNVQRTELSNGIDVLSIYSDEVPLVEIELTLAGGMLFDVQGKSGTANLLANVLNRGTKSKTASELEKAIKQLGSKVNVFASKEKLTISASTLSRNFAATMSIVSEMLMEPRWDPQEFELAKTAVLGQIKQRMSDPKAIATMQMGKITYPKGHPMANTLLGDEQSLTSLSLADLKSYYQHNLVPQFADVQVAGAIKHKDVVDALSTMEQNWTKTDRQLPQIDVPDLADSPTVYFYDVPGAKQSTLHIAHPAVKGNHPDFYRAHVMNYILGGGSFASRLTQELREGKGYTYGIRSRFESSNYSSMFTINTGVRSNVTLEALELIKEIVEQYSDTFTLEDLATTQSYFLKSNARGFETLNAKLNILENIATLDLPVDYMQRYAKQIEALTIDEVKTLAQQHIKPSSLVYLVVGDAKTQYERLAKSDIGKVVRLN
ncbi:M16 family metallopeptidase [Thalassotalea atypica]|uniref:M16 family metallopeptidase n=1 Tax=Thalassotalea atypica TaxID=2054316 RepID=UPI0025740A90|nr:pitrilysin family protein [Thalassotalea atypica]